MAFTLKRILHGTAVIENIPSTASETYVIGSAYKIASDKLTLCTGATDKPTHICVESYVAPASGNRSVAAIKVHPGLEFTALTSADSRSVERGSVLTLTGTTFDGVTATTTNGVFKLTSNGANTAETVTGYFID